MILEEPRVWAPDESLLSETARNLGSQHDLELHWPVLIWLLSPPYPSESTTWLNLLDLTYRCLRPCGHSDDPKWTLFLARAATVLIGKALRINDLVAFEAVNVLCGLEREALLFSSSDECARVEAAIVDTLALYQDSAARDEMLQLAMDSLKTAHIRTLAASDAAAMDVELRSVTYASSASGQTQRSQLASAQLGHLACTLRAFAESQAGGVGAARLTVWGEVEKLSESAFLAIHAGLKALTKVMGNVILTPASIVHGSVETVLRIEASPKNRSQSDAEDSIAPSKPLDIRELNVVHGEAMSLDVVQLIGELQRTQLSLGLELWSAAGDMSSVSFDIKALGKTKLEAYRGSVRVIRSIDVPQANDLTKVIYVVEISADGRDARKVGIPDVGDRQWDYYFHAARILGLVTAFGATTPAGNQIVRTTDQQERLRRLAFLFETSDIGQAWLTWTGSNSVMALPTEKPNVVDFLTNQTESGGSTIGRRADCLIKWVTEFRSALRDGR